MSIDNGLLQPDIIDSCNEVTFVPDPNRLLSKDDVCRLLDTFKSKSAGEGSPTCANSKRLADAMEPLTQYLIQMEHSHWFCPRESDTVLHDLATFSLRKDRYCHHLRMSGVLILWSNVRTIRIQRDGHGHILEKMLGCDVAYLSRLLVRIS